MTSPAKKIASGTSTSSPAMAAPAPAHDFFQRVYTHLKEGRLKSAQDLLNNADATTHNQLPGNKKAIYEFISKEGLSDDARAGNLVKILRKSKLFPEVHHDDFERARMHVLLSSAMAIASTKKVKTHKEVLQEVRASGMKAGLTEDQVNSALEEVVLDDGSRVWMVKTGHDYAVEVWEKSLKILAMNEELILFCEGTQRIEGCEKVSARQLGLEKRGFFRGLETLSSAFKISNFQLCAHLNACIATNAPSALPSSQIMQVINACACSPYARDCLRKTAKTSEHANKVLKILEAKYSDKMMLHELQDIAWAIIFSMNIDEWFDFTSALLPQAYSDSSQEVQKTMAEWIKCSRQYHADRSEKNSEALTKVEGEAVSVARGPRDLEYARIFLEERRNIPRDKLAFVFFGSKHGPGFKQNLLDLHRGLEKKNHSAGDTKKDRDTTPLESSTSSATEKKSKKKKK